MKIKYVIISSVLNRKSAQKKRKKVVGPSKRLPLKTGSLQVIDLPCLYMILAIMCVCVFCFKSILD